MSGPINTSFTALLEAAFKAVKGVAQSNEVPFKTVVATLVLYGVNEFLNDIVFSCPEENFKVYSILFILGPSILLFCLALLVSTPFWQAVTGCCLLRCRGKKSLFLKAKNSLFVSCLPPVIWLVYAFVEEDYYVCAKLGPLDTALAKANSTALRDAVSKEFSQAKTVSQIIAWGLILGLVIVSTIFVTVYRLCLPVDPKLQGNYAYQEYEAEKAVTLFNDKIKPLAEADAKRLIEGLFEKHKDKKGVQQITAIEEQLKNLFPRHAGTLHAPFRVGNGSIKPYTVDSPPPASEDMEMKPTNIMNAAHSG